MLRLTCGCSSQVPGVLKAKNVSMISCEMCWDMHSVDESCELG